MDSLAEDAALTHGAVGKSKAIYKGEPVPHLYVPRIFDREDWETFEEAIEKMMSLSKHVIQLYKDHEEIRALYDFDERLNALICAPNYYDTYVPMGRFDIFYYGEGKYQFCELNADGASAMNEELELSAILKDTKLMRDYPFEKQPEPCELFTSWVDETVVIYKDYLSKKSRTLKEDESFTVGIVDILEKGSPLEFEVFKAAYEEKGIKAVIVDARTLNLKDGKLYTGDTLIDVVYRRLVTKDLMDAYDELDVMIEAINTDAACIIGPIHTQVIHTKRFFEVLYSDTLAPFLSEDEKAFINAHVPYTAPLTKKQDYIDDKDSFIIKPVDYYASKGVCAGSDYSAVAWRELLSDKYDGSFVIQKYCPHALVENAVWEEGVLKMEAFRHITGLFVYNEKLTGVYSRAGRNAIISGLHDGFTLSSLFVK